MSQRRLRRGRSVAALEGVLFACTLGALLLLGPTVPSAKAVQAAGYTHYTSNSVCTQEIVALNEPGVGISGGGFLRSATQSLIWSQGNPCYAANVVAPNAIRVNQVMQKLSGSSWVYCAATQTGDYFNGGLDWNKTITSNYGSSPRCGAGAYRGMGRGWVNGNGGAVVTGPLTLP